MAGMGITISLLAQTGSFDTDIDRSTKAFDKKMRALEKQAQQWGKAVGAAFVAVGTAAVYFGSQVIKGLDALNDIADATGASIENISALEDVALRTGTSMDAVTGALVKFNNTLKELDGKNGASQALKAIGLDAERLKQLDPAEALRQTAVALAKFADDGNKARLVQELFGKSVREVGPLLKDLAEKGALVATVTTEQAKAAEKFRQEIFALEKNVLDLSRALLGKLVPVLNQIFADFRNLGPNMALASAAGDVIALNKELKQLQERKGWGGPFNVGMIDKQIEEVTAKLQAAKRKFNELDVNRPFDPNNQSAAETARLGRRPTVGDLPGTPKASGTDPFKAYMEGLRRQIQGLEELTAVEKVLDDIRNGSLSKITEKQKTILLNMAGQVDAAKELAEFDKATERFMQERVRLQEEELALKREANIADGLAVEAANAIRQSKIADLLDATPSGQLEQQRKDIALLTQEFELFNATAGRAGISYVQYTEAVSARLGIVSGDLKETKTLADELGLTFESALENAIVNFKSLGDVFKSLEQDIVRVITRIMVIEPLTKSLRGAMSGSDGFLGGILGKIFGSGSVGTSWLPAISSGVTIPGFAAGGPVMGGSPILVGEQGPEFFLPNTSGAILPAGPTASMMRGGGGTYNIYVSPPPGTSRAAADQIGARIARQLSIANARNN